MKAKLDPRKAIGEDSIECLECGKRFRQLTNTHPRCNGLTTAEYKGKWRYRPDPQLDQ